MMKKSISTILMLALFAVLALPASAQEATPTPVPTPNANLVAGLGCMQTAVETRDNAVISAWDTFSAAGKSALQTRRDALKTAWGVTDRKERRTDLKKAWNDFKKSSRDARTALNKARKTAWSKFAKDSLSCRKTYKVPNDDSMGQSAEASM